MDTEKNNKLTSALLQTQNDAPIGKTPCASNKEHDTYIENKAKRNKSMTYQDKIKGLFSEALQGINYSYISPNLRKIMVVILSPIILSSILLYTTFTVLDFLYRLLIGPCEYLEQWVDKKRENVHWLTEAVIFSITLPFIFLSRILISLYANIYEITWLLLLITTYIATLGGVRWQAYIIDAEYDCKYTWSFKKDKNTLNTYLICPIILTIITIIFWIVTSSINEMLTTMSSSASATLEEIKMLTSLYGALNKIFMFFAGITAFFVCIVTPWFFAKKSIAPVDENIITETPQTKTNTIDKNIITETSQTKTDTIDKNIITETSQTKTETVNDTTPPPTAPVKKPKTKNIIIIGIVALIAVVVLISVLFSHVTTKDHLYRNVDFGMTAEEVKKAETAKLIVESPDGSLYYSIRDDQETTVYSFDENGKLNLIYASYYGDNYTEGDFFENTKRELDSKHGYGKECSFVEEYDGYEWLCDGYIVRFIYWKDGELTLTYLLNE